MHVSLDEATMIPEKIHLTPAKISDRRGADNFRYPSGTIVVDDRGYFDFELFATRIADQNHFVTLIRVCLTQYNRLEYIVNEIQITVQKAKRVYKPPETAQQTLALG